MFIDRILADDNLPNCFYPKLDLNNLRACMKQAVCFDISNVEAYFHEKQVIHLNNHDLPNVRPVYDQMWSEFKVIGGMFNDYLVKTVGVLTCINHDRELYKDGNIHLCSTSVIEFYDSRVIPFISGHICWTCSLSGDLVSFQVSLGTGEELEPTHENFDKTKILLISGIMVLWLSLSFLHCKNIEVSSVDIPEKLQQARVKRGKLPLLQFKTLNIHPMTKILRDEGQADSKGLQYALHICRGHFKDFSHGAGLFGRNKGLYWWDAQVRGKATEGIVLKDYNVSPN